MKKKMIASAAMSMALVAAMGSTAFAAGQKTGGAGTSTAPVYVYGDGEYVGEVGTITLPGTYKTDAKADEIKKNYYVEIYWETTQNDLTYTIGSNAYSWKVFDAVTDGTEVKDPKAGAAKSAGYVFDKAAGTWSGAASVKLTVNNWSNAPVKATLTSVAGTHTNGDTATFTGKTETLDLASAAANANLDGTRVTTPATGDKTLSVSKADIAEGTYITETDDDLVKITVALTAAN